MLEGWAQYVILQIFQIETIGVINILQCPNFLGGGSNLEAFGANGHGGKQLDIWWELQYGGTNFQLTIQRT